MQRPSSTEVGLSNLDGDGEELAEPAEGRTANDGSFSDGPEQAGLPRGCALSMVDFGPGVRFA